MEKILFVGGTFNNDLNDKGLYGKKSGLVNKFYNNFKNKSFEIKCVNGGKYDELKCLLKESSNYDYVFWWANVVFVSKRNVNKQFIELDNFVPVWLENNKLMYSGNDKPSVDTPVQIRLYNYLSNINYMLHSHCYIKNAPFTNRAIPCGAIEEFDEIIKIINDINKDYYAINLIGHGSIIMWNNMKQFHETIEPKLSYIKRPMPEYMKEE